MNEMSNSKRLEKTITNLTDMVEKYVHSNSNSAIVGMMSIGEQTDKNRQMENWFDELWYLKKITKMFAKAEEKNLSDLNPEDNPYTLKRLYKKNQDRISDIAKHGFYDESGVKVVKGLGEILEPFKKDLKKLTEIRVLLVARRNIDYLVRNLGSGIGITDTINAITNITDRDVINAVEEIEEFASYPLELAYKNGMLTEEQYEEIKKWNKFYVPLNRVFEEQIRQDSGKNNNQIVKKRTGSQRDIIDPLESIIINTGFMLDKIYQNEVMNVLANHKEVFGISDYYSVIALPQKLTASVSLDMFKTVLQEQIGEQNVEDLDIDFDIVKNLFSPKLSDDKTQTLTYMENGKLKAIQFYNKSLYEIFSGDMGRSQQIAEWLKAFDNMTGILRAGATSMNVEFSLTNMLSDTFVAWVYSDNGFIPVVDTVRGMFDVLIAENDWGKQDTENKRIYSYYKQSGATMSTRVGAYRADVQEFLKEVIGKYSNEIYSDDPKTVKKAFKKIIEGAKRLPNGIQDVLSFLPELSEQATRFSYFKKSYNKWLDKGYTHKQALLKAGIDTKDSTLDFNRAGKYMRSINRLKAFANASMQGTYRAIEGVAKAPKKTLGRVAFLAIMWLVIKSSLDDDNKEFEEITDQVKKDNYVFSVGDRIIKIKKPQDFLTRNVLNFAETLYNVATGKTVKYEEEWKNLLEEFISSISFIDINLDKGLKENVGINLQGTAIEGIIESVADYDLYYGSQITPYGTEENSSQYQYDAYTSKTAIKLGQTELAKFLKLSPAEIEHLIVGYGARSSTTDTRLNRFNN